MRHPSDKLHTLLRILRRRLFHRLPFLPMASNVSDVVYLNWLVKVEDVKHLVPAGVQLWQHQGRTVLSVLTYHHGHFGPRPLKLLRFLFPSPVQSNWRLYVSHLGTEAVQVPTVLFFKNALNNLLYVLGATLLTDGLAAECPEVLAFRAKAPEYRIKIHPGYSDFPDLKAELIMGRDEAALNEFSDFFGDLDTALHWLVLQQQAITRVPELSDTLALASIELPVALETIVPLRAPEGIQSNWLAKLVRQSQPLCFLLPKVAFAAIDEKLLKVSGSCNNLPQN